MSELDELIDVQVTVQDQAPERPNFGTPLIASYHTRFGERVREYSQADDMLDDGFTTSDPEYKTASIIKMQNPTLQRFKIGRLETASHKQELHFIPNNVTPGYVYSFSVDDVDVEYEVQEGDSTADIVGEFETQLANVQDATASDSGTDHATLTAVNDGHIFDVSLPHDGHVRVLDATTVSGTDLSADLSAIEDEDPSWYGLLLTLNCEDTILAGAAWCEARRKVFFPQSADWNIVDATKEDDVASQLVAAGYTRTCGIWKRGIGANAQAAAAFATVNLAPDPGSSTPAFKTLVGVPFDRLRPGERAALEKKNWTRYTRVAGFNITFEGRTPSGRFVDVTRGIDWIVSEIQLDLYRYLYVNPKVPYTSTGLSGAKGTIEGAIMRGVTAGLVADDTPIVVTMPSIDETDVNDRANRLVTGATFEFRLAGAAHRFRVRGTVTV